MVAVFVDKCGSFHGFFHGLQKRTNTKQNVTSKVAMTIINKFPTSAVIPPLRWRDTSHHEPHIFPTTSTWEAWLFFDTHL